MHGHQYLSLSAVNYLYNVLAIKAMPYFISRLVCPAYLWLLLTESVTKDHNFSFLSLRPPPSLQGVSQDRRGLINLQKQKDHVQCLNNHSWCLVQTTTTLQLTVGDNFKWDH